jgi:hypothetical protein
MEENMAYCIIDRLRVGDINYLRSRFFVDSERKEIAQIIRGVPDRVEIMKRLLPEFMNYDPRFCFAVIYDMEEFKDEVLMLLDKHPSLKLDCTQIKDMLYNSKFGEEYVFNHLDTIFSEDDKNKMAIIIEFAYKQSENKDKWIAKLSRHSNLHFRALFIIYIIKQYPEEITKIYDDLTKFMTGHTGLSGEQLVLFLDRMSSEDISEIVYVCLESPLDRSIYMRLKAYLLANYAENDLARLMLEDKKIPLGPHSYIYQKNELGIAEFALDADRLFTTSRTYKIEILHRFREHVSRKLMEEFAHFVNQFDIDANWVLSPLFGLYFNGLGREFSELVEKYLELSKDRSIEFIGRGSTSHCFRLGDYVIKLLRSKWSYEDVICPNLYLIAKNLEEHLLRDQYGYVYGGIEVQRYLKRSAKDLPHSYFDQFTRDLRDLGYYTTDTLMSEKCGDNCRILDSYMDADHPNPESLPDSFKKVPLVLIDRDRVYSIDNKFPKQISESRS